MTAIKGFVTQIKTHPALTLGGTAILGTAFAGLPGALFGVAMGAIIVGYDGVKSLFVGTGGARGGGSGDPGIRPEFAGESDPADRPFEKAFLLDADEISPSSIRSSDFGGVQESAIAKSAFFGDDAAPSSDDQGGDDGPPAPEDDSGGGGSSDGSSGDSSGAAPSAKPSAPTGQSSGGSDGGGSSDGGDSGGSQGDSSGAPPAAGPITPGPAPARKQVTPGPAPKRVVMHLPPKRR